MEEEEPLRFPVLGNLFVYTEVSDVNFSCNPFCLSFVHVVWALPTSRLEREEMYSLMLVLFILLFLSLNFVF